MKKILKKTWTPGDNFKSCKCLFFECSVDYIDASVHWGKLPETIICLCRYYQNTWFENWSTSLGEFSVARCEKEVFAMNPLKTLAAGFFHCCCYFCKDKENWCIAKV